LRVFALLKNQTFTQKDILIILENILTLECRLEHIPGTLQLAATVPAAAA
jgi:hypothetical protein